VLRARRRGLLRNAAVVLGNCGDPAIATPALRRCLRDEPDDVVRQHAAWALERVLGG
jgi:epoxyqueuosine reductase